MLYHATGKNRLPKIMKEGLSPHADTLASEYAREMFPDEEKYDDYVSDCSTEAQEYLDEDLNRGDNVFFALSKGRAFDITSGIKDLPYSSVVIEVNPSKIPCTCKVSDQSIADDIYYEYYHACMQDILVDSEHIENLVDDWDKTVKTFDANKQKDYDEYSDEVWCPCHIPPDAIEKVYDSDGMEICRRDADGKLRCDTKKEEALSWEHRRPPSRGSLIREAENWG